ncbi:Gfo/Idh/MocA family oxidoreductase [Actinopolyspora mortivallis]|uniref:Oxidoreductase n=1 Tax=Actinopolyspora mortivallis TaxID=33906 RepID=A0A2T0H153_ACTMO|nr:Gfo/Idh/MocA family oxidoreductase [Actinopolyspora mortivallis]PRW65108.1 oxidoreductase [Actinopolyspora mortivallis]
MDSPERLRVGLLGYGLAGEVFHAPLIRAEPRMRLDAVMTGNQRRAEQVRQDHPGTRVFPRAESLFERSDELDLVVVATPNSSHAELTGRALDAGLPVVVDKPFTPTAAQARDLVERARRRAVPLTVFQNRRWDSDVLTLRRVLEAGELGRVHRFESRFERWVPTPKDSWRDSGGPEDAAGVLYDLGSHLVDQARLLFGPVESVYAEMRTLRDGVRADDDSFVALRHSGGVNSHLWTGKLAAQQGPRLRVLGDRGAFTKYGMDAQEAALRAGGLPGDPDWGSEDESLWATVGVGERTRRCPSEPGRYQDFYAGVASALESGGEMPVDPADAVHGLAVIEAAIRSARNGSVETPVDHLGNG